MAPGPGAAVKAAAGRGGHLLEGEMARARKHTYRAPRINGYHLVWQDSYGHGQEEASLEKLVDAELKARAQGWDVLSYGIPGRHLLYVSNTSLRRAEAAGII